MTGKPKNQPRKFALPDPKQDAPPRELQAIHAEYQQIALQAGQAQYQAFVHSEELKNLNQRLLSLNREAARRNELDSAAKKEAPSEQPA